MHAPVGLHLGADIQLISVYMALFKKPFPRGMQDGEAHDSSLGTGKCYWVLSIQQIQG